MSRSSDIETLLDRLDMIEKRIEGERLRYGNVAGRMLVLLLLGDARPLAARRASRRRIRRLERERERLLGLRSESLHESKAQDGRSSRS